MSRTRLVIGLMAAGLVGGCATAGSGRLPSQSTAINNFQQVAPGLYRGAQPDAIGMQALKEMGIKTILSLRVPESVIEWERAEAERLGMMFVSLPVDNYDSPSEREIREFLAITTDPTHQPVFVHCRQGQLRTGALVASYRVIEEGWTAQQAYREAKQYGFTDAYPWYLPLKWFVKDLDDTAPQFVRTPTALSSSALQD